MIDEVGSATLFYLVGGTPNINMHGHPPYTWAGYHYRQASSRPDIIVPAGNDPSNSYVDFSLPSSSPFVRVGVSHIDRLSSSFDTGSKLCLGFVLAFSSPPRRCGLGCPQDPL